MSGNAPQAFTSSSSGTLRTCFEDVVLVPLASWIFLLALLGYVAYALSRRAASRGNRASLHKLIHRRQQAPNTALLQTTEKEAEEAVTQRGTPGTPRSAFAARWPKTMTFLSILYSLLVLATILMSECVNHGARLDWC